MWSCCGAAGSGALAAIAEAAARCTHVSRCTHVARCTHVVRCTHVAGYTGLYVNRSVLVVCSIEVPLFEHLHSMRACLVAPTKIIAGLGMSFGIDSLDAPGAR